MFEPKFIRSYGSSYPGQFQWWIPLLWQLMNLVIICSVLIMNSFGGFGITVAMWVNLDMTQVLMMLTFAVMDGFSELHWYASCRALSRVLSQFI